MKRLSGQARYRLLIGFLFLILFYYAYRSFSDYSNRLIHEVNKVIADATSSSLLQLILIAQFQDQLEFAKSKGAPVLVSVYYEALCPDSKGFLMKQLMPAYRKIPNLIEIEFFPYGKATTHTLPDGALHDTDSDKNLA